MRRIHALRENNQRLAEGVLSSLYRAPALPEKKIIGTFVERLRFAAIGVDFEIALKKVSKSES